jgi:type VI secretion system protein ImpF
MQAFRDAARARDSRKIIDERNATGERVIAGRRNMTRRATNEQVLRRELSEDLATLLNTVNFGSTIDISDLPYVASSILNFGFADVSALTIDEMAVADVSAELREILQTYEPRLVPESIEVERDAGLDTNGMRARFTIRAEMRANPVDVPVEFVAELEIETAKMQISRL